MWVKRPVSTLSFLNHYEQTTKSGRNRNEEEKGNREEKGGEEEKKKSRVIHKGRCLTKRRDLFSDL